MGLLKTVKHTLFNIFYFKVVLLILSCATLLVPIRDISFRLMFITLIWGAVLALYDLFTQRRFLTAKRSLWLIIFMACFAVAVVLNFRNSLNLNVASWGYTFLALFILYPNHVQDKERAIHEMSVLNYIYIAITAVLSTLSFGMYAIQYVSRTQVGDAIYVVGWDQNRLFGLYSNTGLMMTAIGLAIIVIQTQINRYRNQTTPRGIRAFLGYTAVINFLCMTLENALGAFISLAAFVLVYIFFQWRQKGLDAQAPVSKTYLRAVVASVCSLVILFSGIYLTRQVLSYVPSVTEYAKHLIGSEPVDHPPEIKPGDIEREIPEGYSWGTGRADIWKFGIDQFIKKPLFGYGPNSHRQYKVVDIGLRHFHNLIIQCLVSVGIFGSIAVLFFLAATAWELLSKVWKRQYIEPKHYRIVVALLAFLMMLAVNSMAEVTLLFLQRPSMFMFWYYLGYIMVLTRDDKVLRSDKLMSQFSASLGKLFRRTPETV